MSISGTLYLDKLQVLDIEVVVFELSGVDTLAG